jgi:alcohol dehydrogenase
VVNHYPGPAARTQTIRAVIYDAVGARPDVRLVPAPPCPPDGVVVDVAATGVCRSDWHAWRGHDPVPLPHTPGHEWAGVVAEVGAQVSSGATGFSVGDRVTAPFVLGCGRCAWCLQGSAQVCPDQEQPGFTYAGSFAEQVVVRAAGTNLVRLPDSVDLVAAAALGCRFATAFRALTGVARVQPGEWVAVVGCGGVGLSAVMIAAALGAQVVAVDVSPAARGRALELGAAVALPAEGAVAAIHDLTEGGAHVGLDALGSRATLDASVRSLRRHGRHVQVGLLLGEAAGAPVPWDLVVGRELQLLGSHGMSAVDYPAMLAMVADGRLDPARLVGSVITLDEAGAALAAMDDPSSTRSGMTVVSLARSPFASAPESR